jgi:hypothetical protein
MRLVGLFAIGTMAIAAPVLAAKKPASWIDFYGAERSPEIPKKVRKFVTDAQACIHFRGELGDPDEQRERQVSKAVMKHCKNLEARRETLLTKHRGNAAVETIIAELGELFL